MATLDARDCFEALGEDDANQSCFESGAAAPAWASVSHGIFISIGAAGIHRSLGVQVSRVQSVEMDAWKPLQLRMMELGGNRRFRDFLQDHGVPDDLPIRDKYNTRAAGWYRRNLLAEAQGSAPPLPLPLGVGILPMQGSEPSVLDKIFVDVRLGDSTEASGRDVAKVSDSGLAAMVREPITSGESWVCKRLCKGFKVVLGATGTRRPAWDLEKEILGKGDLAARLGDWTETLASRIHVGLTGEVQIDSCATAAGKVVACG